LLSVPPVMRMLRTRKEKNDARHPLLLSLSHLLTIATAIATAARQLSVPQERAPEKKRMMRVTLSYYHCYTHSHYCHY